MSQPDALRSQAETGLPIQTWSVVADSQHNAFTDLLYWREAFWLVYVASPTHFASPRSRLVLLRSPDASRWQEMARFSGDGQDIRDPKLAVIGDRLLLYALLNRKFDPQPYQTICTWSDDGKTWSAFIEAISGGWLLGKPKTPDGLHWYAPAHHLELEAAQIFHSVDGVRWEPTCVIAEQRGVDETGLVFTPDGALWAVSRLEAGAGLFGGPQNGTLISCARPPYLSWVSQARCCLTRLDSPNLFYHERVYAVGRFQPQAGGRLHGQGSILGRKRTALFLVAEQELFHLDDLPSSGDTAYAGVALLAGQLTISYYTNDPRHDPPWIWGMFRPTRIQISRISLSALTEIAIQRLAL